MRAKKSKASIDEALEGMTGKLTEIAALGIAGNSRSGSEVLPTLNRWGSRSYGDTYQALNRSAHRAYTGDLRDLLRDTRALISKVEERLR